MLAAGLPVAIPPGTKAASESISEAEASVLVRGTIWSDPRIEAFEEPSGSDLPF